MTVSLLGKENQQESFQDEGITGAKEWKKAVMCLA